MDSNISYFSLPFVDTADLDFGKIRGQECEYDDLHSTLPSHGSLLGADDDVLAQFLSGDDPLEEPDLNGPTTLHCEICMKQFDNAKKYYGHLRVHSKDNLWTCDRCPNEKFSTKQQLMKHSLTHQPLERVWRCPQCEMSFEALWRLQQHLFATHLDYRPHKCDVCSKTFHKLSDLDIHKGLHSEKYTHECILCEKKFNDRSNLKRHMLVHGDVKPYACPGCGHRFKQIASMRRHGRNCSMVQKNTIKKSYRNNYCRVCGLTFQYKSSLLEHCVREHSANPSQPPLEPPKEDKSNQFHVDTNRTVDNIVDDILSAEDDYMTNNTMSTQNELINYPTEETQDNLMQIELLKEMNQMNNMHILDEELLYNDIDLDSFQTMCNNIEYERNELFDLNDGRSMDIMNGKSLDQDIMNAIVRGIDQSKDELPKEFTEQPEMSSKINEFLVNPPVSVNECATIFESDVDLEASTNLAANLNQLIGENTVQYIATDTDDTFIISLNSEIDAEQLTDMLNIGVDKTKNETFDVNQDKSEAVPEPKPSENVVEHKKEETTEESKKKGRKKVMYVCMKCKKVFKTKHNYTSHRGTHDSDLQLFQCKVCLERFSYKSSLNKHLKNKHMPLVRTPHTCVLCDKNYNAAWQLKQHTERDHQLLQPYQCSEKDCGKKLYKKCDLDTHMRFHSGEKPYVCEICARGFKTRSHLARHVKNVDCTKFVKQQKDEKGLLATPQPSKRKDRKTKSAKSSPVKPQNSKKEDSKAESAKSSLVKPQNSKKEDSKAESAKSSLVKPQNSKKEDSKTKSAKSSLEKPQNSKKEDSKAESSKSSLEKTQNSKKEVSKAESAKSSLVKPQNSKKEDSKAESAKSSLEKPQNSEKENSKAESANSSLEKPQNSEKEDSKAESAKSSLEKPQNAKIKKKRSWTSRNVILTSREAKIENKKRKTRLAKPLDSKKEINTAKAANNFLLTSQNSKIEENKANSLLPTSQNSKIEQSADNDSKGLHVKPQNMLFLYIYV